MTRGRYEIFVKTHWFSKNTLLQRYTYIADIYTHRPINADTYQTPPHDEYILYIVKRYCCHFIWLKRKRKTTLNK